MRGNLCRKIVASLNNRSVRRACPTNLRNIQHRRGHPSENPIGRPLQSSFISPRAHARISTIVAVFCLHAFTIPRKPLIARGLLVKAKPKFAFTNTRFVKAVKAKNTTYSVVYTRAREAIRPVDAGKPQRGSRGISLRGKQNYL